jgi:hypothetical protein
MDRLYFCAFYSSRGFWVEEKLDVGSLSPSEIKSAMSEEIISLKEESHWLVICRDGRIMLRIPSLEYEDIRVAAPDIKTLVRKWSEYLNFINSLYFLMDASVLEKDNFGLFNLHELTNRDVFRVTYDDGKFTGENIATESIASVFQSQRYVDPQDPSMSMWRSPPRWVVSKAALDHASEQFSRVMKIKGLERKLASFAKSISEYKIGNYSTCIILSWFLIESSLSSYWDDKLASENDTLSDDTKRINSDRKKFLTGRDFSISMVSNILELWGVLSTQLFRQVDTVRGIRNKIVHGDEYSPAAEDAQLALQVAQQFIEKRWGLHFTLSLNYSISGF